MEDKRLKVLEKFVNERLPEPERNRVIIIVENNPLTWKQVIEELKKGGDYANKIKEKFKELLK